MSMYALGSELVALLKAQSKHITTIESCTGGMVAAAITRVPGSSEVFDYGFVTYSNAAKSALVGVPAPTLEAYGAVSVEVAAAMAEGGRKVAKADIALSITGIAGPSGGSLEKPVGTVCFGLAFLKDDMSIASLTQVRQFGGIGRDEVREASVAVALGWAIEALKA